MLMSTECPKCQGVLEEGFMTDPADKKPAHMIWVEGSPQKTDDGVKTEGLRKYRTQAYRCMSCGYTELYSEMSL